MCILCGFHYMAYNYSFINVSLGIIYIYIYIYDPESFAAYI